MNLSKLDKSKWMPRRFDEIATMVSERVDPNETDLDIYVGLEHIDPENLHITRHGSSDDVNGTKLRFYPGDVIFGRRRAYQRKAAIAESHGFCSAHAMILRAKPAVIDPDLFPFFLHSDQFMHRAVDISVGSLSPTINWKSLRKQTFLLPPKAEQARLAELLWAGDAVVEGKLMFLEGLISYNTALLKDKLPNCALQKVDSFLAEPPKNGFSPKSSVNGIGSRTISISAVNNGRLQIEGNEKYASVKEDVLEKYSIQKDDVFVVRGNGNKSLCGKAAIASSAYQDTFYPDLLIRLRFDSDIVIPKFANYLWNVPQIHNQLSRFAKTTNGTWKINGKDVKRHKLPVPDIKVQKEIIHELDKAERIVQVALSNIEACKSLQKSLINQIL